MSEIKELRRREMGRKTKYRRIEYIESDGHQFTDLFINPTKDLRIKVKVMNLVRTGDSIIGVQADGWRLFNTNGSMYWDIPGSRLTLGNAFYPNIIYEFEIGNNYVKNIRGGNYILQGDVKNFERQPHTISINGDIYNGRLRCSSNRFYYVKAYEGDTLIGDFVPVMAGGKAVIYDKVQDRILGNDGTGDYIAGPFVGANQTGGGKRLIISILQPKEERRVA